LGVGYRTGQFRSSSVPVLETVEVDQGDVDMIVTENGFLESSGDDAVRCRVESFQGLPVGAPPANWEPRHPQAKATRTSPNGVSPASGATGPTIIAAFKAKMKSKLPAERQGAVKGSTTGAGAAPKIGASTTPTGSPAAGSSSSSTPGLDPAMAAKLPLIRSFDHVVEPHIPLRTALPDQGVIPTAAPPPPAILSILPEGSRVKAGDVVCELDSSAFRDALQVQQIRTLQAKAWVEQAKSILQANEIALLEYEEGVFPQDIELVRHYVEICEIERSQARRNLAWARAALAKGFRTAAQLDADGATLQQAEIALSGAEGMLVRLVKYTGERIKKARRAKIEAINADLLSLQSCFLLESERKKRIEAMIANCTMRAPRDGIVVHANRSNGWGRVEMQIRPGLPVYPSQPIFRLLDPRHLQVRARINESQVALVRSGQPVLIHLDAFPDRPLRGSVAAIIPIPSLADGPYSDVRYFYATVRIESGGFDELSSGLSAELEFLVQTRRRVTRVPLESIRWVGDQTFAAMASSTPGGDDWLWKPVALGATDTTFAEVKSGLAPGDRVIAHCESLPELAPGQPESEPKLDLAMLRRQAGQ